MATFTTRDDVTIYYKGWGPRDGEVVILSHGWPLNAIYAGGPHGITDTHKERLNKDLLAFVRS